MHELIALLRKKLSILKSISSTEELDKKIPKITELDKKIIPILENSKFEEDSEVSNLLSLIYNELLRIKSIVEAEYKRLSEEKKNLEKELKNLNKRLKFAQHLPNYRIGTTFFDKEF